MRRFPRLFLPPAIGALASILVGVAMAVWAAPRPIVTAPTSAQDDYPFDDVQDLAIDIDNNLMWLATTDGGVRIDLDTVTFDHYTTTHGLAENRLTSVAVDDDHYAWFGTWWSGVSRCDSNGGDWQTYDSSSTNLIDDRVYAMAVDPDGYIWAGGYYGASRSFSGNHWTLYYGWHTCSPAGSHCNPIWSQTVGGIAFASNDDWWFAVDQMAIGICPKPGGVGQRDAITGTWNTWKMDDGLPTHQAEAIALDSSDIAWVATMNGAARYNGDDTWTAYKTDNSPLLNNRVNDVVVDSGDNVWFATDVGVNRVLTTGTWMTYTVSEGLISNHVNAMLAYSDTVCFGTDVGVCCLDLSDSSWAYYVENRSLILTAPNGGEKLLEGAPFNITWESFGLPGDVQLVYSRDSFVTTHTIAAVTPNDGGYLWRPGTADITTSVRVSITSLFDPAFTDASDGSFDIVATVGRVYLPLVLRES